MRTRILPVLLLLAVVLWPAVSGAAQGPAAGSGSGGTSGPSPSPAAAASPGQVRAIDPLGSDDFGRSVAPGWGTAPVGGRWQVEGAPDEYSVSKGTGWLTLDRAGASRAAFQETNAADVAMVGRVRTDRVPADGNLFLYLVARRAGTTEIRLKARLAPSGEVHLQATTVVDGAEADLGDEVRVDGMRMDADQDLWLRGRVEGSSPTRVRFRAWVEGTPEPTGWPVDVLATVDALQGVGQAGVRAYLGGSTTNAPIAVSVDDWRVTIPAAIPDPTAAPSPAATDPAGPTVAPSPTPVPTPPPGPLDLVVADRFRRVTERGWGETPEGLRWTHGGSADSAAVDGRAGTLRTEPGATTSAMLQEISLGDAQATATVRADTPPVGASAWVYLVLRRTPAGDEARGRVRLMADGSVRVGVSLVVGGEERTIGPELVVRGLHIGPSRPIRVRFAAHGSAPTTWSIRAWPAGAAEPEAWQVAVDDATPSLQGAGSVGIRGYVGRAAAVDEIRLRIDEYTLRPVAAPAVVTSPMLAGAGDIAICGSSGAVQTAALLDAIDGTVFAVGDLAYPDGTPDEFEACFGPTWGRFRERMLPALGNREYATPEAAGYFGYFGERAAGPGGWYAVDLGAWRVYILNSECRHVDCGADSPQLRWLLDDLAANPRHCSLALWHSPRFTSGPHGDTVAVARLWEVLHAAGAELIVSGHDHDYERLLPMDPAGRLDTEHGIVQFVAGTGGGGGATFEAVRANSVVREGSTLGVLKLTLHPDGYDWRFLPVTGRTFTDSGSRTCHDAP